MRMIIAAAVVFAILALSTTMFAVQAEQLWKNKELAAAAWNLAKWSLQVMLGLLVAAGIMGLLIT